MKHWRNSFYILSATIVMLFGSNICEAQQKQERSAAAQRSQNRRSSRGPQSIIALKNATIHSLSNQGTFVGTIIVRNSRIAEVGKDVKIPDGAKELDLTGFTIIPGMIDSRSTLWLTSNASREAGTKATLNILDGVDPFQKDWQEVAAQGVTSVYVQPSSRGTLGGYGAVLGVAPATSMRQIVVKPEAGIQAAVGLTGRTTRDRYAQVGKLKSDLEKAKPKPEKKGTDSKSKSKSATKSGASKSGAPSGSRRRGRIQIPPGMTPREFIMQRMKGRTPSSSSSSKKDPTTEALEKVFKGTVPLRVEVIHPDTTKWMIELAEKLEIQVVLDRVSDVGSNAELMTKSANSFVAGPLFSTSATNKTPEKMAWLKDAEGVWAISTFGTSPRQSRTLRLHAAAAVSMGVDKETALKAVTINAAKILGIARQTGSIEKGKLADLAIFAGDPLDPSTQTRMVLSQGRVVHDAKIDSRKSATVDSAELPEKWPAAFAIRTTNLLRNGEFKPATVVVKDGKIAKIVGADAKLDYRIIDLKDLPVSAGLVAAHTQLGQANALQDISESDTTHLRAADGVDPTSKAGISMIEGGFLSAAVAMNSSNTSAGIVGQLNLGSSDYVANPEIANKFVLASSARNTSRYPASMPGQMELIQDILSNKPIKTRLFISSAVADAMNETKKEIVASILAGQRTAIFDAESDTEIQAALQIAEKFKLKSAILSSNSTDDFIEKMTATKTGLIVKPITGLEYNTYFAQLKTAADAGVPFAFSGDSPAQIRLTASMVVAHGVPEKVALLGLTSGAAKMVSMNAGTGELKAGQSADFVIWSGSILNPASQPLALFVNGKAR